MHCDFNDYFATFSSHFNMPSMMDMEMRQISANTPHVIHWCGKAFNILTPRKISRFPMAVAVSHKPWHTPTMWRGAILETNDKPNGEMNNSATVRKK